MRIHWRKPVTGEPSLEVLQQAPLAIYSALRPPMQRDQLPQAPDAMLSLPCQTVYLGTVSQKELPLPWAAFCQVSENVK